MRLESSAWEGGNERTNERVRVCVFHQRNRQKFHTFFLSLSLSPPNQSKKKKKNTIAVKEAMLTLIIISSMLPTDMPKYIKYLIILLNIREKLTRIFTRFFSHFFGDFWGADPKSEYPLARLELCHEFSSCI